MVITGRGRSLLALRRILQRHDQNELFLAMYNGAVIEYGSSKRNATATKMNLKGIYKSLKRNHQLQGSVSMWRLKSYFIQAITRRKSTSYMDDVCSHLQNVLPNSVVARNSGYSVDVYPRQLLKVGCLRVINNILGEDKNYLRIGDQGHEQGNDFDLLNARGGFSVGTISANPRTCFPVLDRNGKPQIGPSGVISLLSRFA